MKSILIMALLIFIVTPTIAATSKEKNVRIGLLDPRPRSEVEATTLNWLKSEVASCRSCEVLLVTSYDENGNVDWKTWQQKVSKLRNEIDILYLAWNEPYSAEKQNVVDTLSQLQSQGLLVVGTAGRAEANGRTAPLNKTLLGKVSGVIIVGELTGRERLVEQSFFGPEMLTAIARPKDSQEFGIGPIRFVGRWASGIEKRSAKLSAEEWNQHFQVVKQRTRKIWPNLDDFFGR